MGMVWGTLWPSFAAVSEGVGWGGEGLGLGIVRGQQLSGTLGIVCEQLLSKAGRGWGLRISWYGVCYQGVVVAVELYDMMLVAVWFGLVCKLPLAFLEASPASCLPPPPSTTVHCVCATFVCVL